MTVETKCGGDMRRSRWRLFPVVLVLAGVVLVGFATRTEAQIGCCYCDNCPPVVGPLCTDLMNSSASCVDLCIVQRGCAVLEFSPQGTCAQGCGSKPPFFSPTPTTTATLTCTETPTISPTPSITPTPMNTQTPRYCCQGTNLCRTSNQPNLAICPNPDETPVQDASCDGNANQCKTFTPTFTVTNTPTRTNTKTSTPTPTSTQTPTPTPTIFMGNLFNCDRITSKSHGKMFHTPVIVTDPLGTRDKVVLKPKYLCSPGVFGPSGATIANPQVYFTCYKSRDANKIPGGQVMLRNQFDMPTPIAVTLIKGDLLCIPSYEIPTPTPKPPSTPFTPTRTPTTAPTNTP